MNYLVDTHVFLWILFDPKKISKLARAILKNQDATKYVSTITFWEIALKFSLGKIELTGVLPEKLPKAAQETGFELLSMEADTAATFYKLSRGKNKDPFDRMLAWIAIRNKFALLTKDKEFKSYKKQGLRTVW